MMNVQESLTSTITSRRLIAAMCVMTLAIAACGSDDAADPAPPQDTGTTSGNDGPTSGTVECSETAIRAGLEGYDDTIVSVDGFQCEDGWAVASLSVADDPDDPDEMRAGIAVLEAEGQFWIPKDQGDVCGSLPEIDDNGQPIYPDDAQVPASLWPLACWSN